jgi:hypothetical protein
MRARLSPAGIGRDRTDRGRRHQRRARHVRGFSLFATTTSLDLMQAGVGLAVAVILDATVVRAVLLPASMKLLGDWNWYLPSWLAWIPMPRPAGGRRADWRCSDQRPALAGRS